MIRPIDIRLPGITLGLQKKKKKSLLHLTVILQTKTYLFFLHKNIFEGRLPSVVSKTRRIASLFPLGPVCMGTE